MSIKLKQQSKQYQCIKAICIQPMSMTAMHIKVKQHVIKATDTHQSNMHQSNEHTENNASVNISVIRHMTVYQTKTSNNESVISIAGQHFPHTNQAESIDQACMYITLGMHYIPATEDCDLFCCKSITFKSKSHDSTASLHPCRPASRQTNPTLKPVIHHHQAHVMPDFLQRAHAPGLGTSPHIFDHQLSPLTDAKL
jgi:hypothetical protein